jgi:hypothetical protein
MEGLQEIFHHFFKGTVSQDIAFYFRVYKFKSVLSVRPLMVFKFILLFRYLNIHFKTASMQTLTNYVDPY